MLWKRCWTENNENIEKENMLLFHELQIVIVNVNVRVVKGFFTLMSPSKKK